MKCSFQGCRVKLSIVCQVCPCSYCKKCYCIHHRLPEVHECPDLEEGVQNKKEIRVKPKFVDYPRGGSVGA